MILGLNEQLTGIVKLKITRTAFDKLLIRDALIHLLKNLWMFKQMDKL